ncbi:hypothetical protein ADIMK_0855 [Marinobacterium lacunae]|uniref:Uncharacterized protein n=1 Tax=Marinobacterium lacunae TaxID=1232683 RepID=A0A081G2Z8_9GAMM|nr:hypothetical protein [Marinobacterium lacunae]KEA65153.1 hypothetical protein ADIMK_0855 [Marinobacterium lacunae]MBR9885877.1 hypothetical protein [Oceanospirillales bacterium]
MNMTISFILLMLSAWFDAKGFQYATQTWSAGGHVALKQGALSLVFFLTGVSIYLYSVRFLTLAGVSSSTLQTLLWFAATIAGVAVISGDFQKWNVPHYAALVAVVIGLATLMALGEH